MPSRLVCIVIVIFWLGMLTALICRDYLPWLTADSEGPSFSFELADEVVTQNALWTLYRNGKKIGTARSNLRFLRNNTFEWTNSLANLEHSARVGDFELKVLFPTILTETIVNPRGELISFKTNADMNASLMGLDLKAKFQIEAKVDEDRLSGNCMITSALGTLESPFGPVIVKAKSVFSPMQPLFRIKGLRPGQRWKMTDFDPQSEAYKAAIEQVLRNVTKDDKNAIPIPFPSSSNELLAEVSEATQDLNWKGKVARCLVIEYRGETTKGRTWVNADDGTVIRQEVSGHGEVLVLERE